VSKSKIFWRNATRTMETGDFAGKKGQTASACRNAPRALLAHRPVITPLIGWRG